MFDQDADEAFITAQNRAVQHDRAMARAIFADIAGIEPFGQHGIGLDGADLPCPPDGIGEMEFQLGRIKSPFAGQFFPAPIGIIAPRCRHGIAHRLFRPVPHCVAAETLFRAQRQLDRIGKAAEILVDKIEQVTEAGDFADNLVFAAEDMGVVLGELPHPHQAVQRAMRFVAMAAAHLRQPQRQVAVRLDALAEDQDVRRAVHRLERHPLRLVRNHRAIVIDIGHFVGNDEHVLAIFAPVAGLFPLPGVHDLRRLDLAIAGGIEPAPHIGLEGAIDDKAARVPEDAAMGFFLQVEQIHLAAQLAMVALRRFLEPRQMRLELLLVEPAGAIDAGQHRIGLIAAPIGARHPRQLERLRIKLAGRWQMRPAAHVEPVFARPIDGQILVARQFGGPFSLEAFALLLPAADELLAAPHLAGDRLVGGNQRAHLGFDRRQVLVGERAIAPVNFWGREIIIKAIVGRWAKGDLRAGEQPLHRFGEQMRIIMPRQFERVGLVLRRHQRQLRIGHDRPRQIDDLAVDTRRQRRLQQARPDARRDIRPGRAARHLAHGTIGKGQENEIGHDVVFRS